MSGESTLEQWSELAGHVIMQKYPILPKPHWGQDVAYVAFVLDNLVERGKQLAATYDAVQSHPESGDPVANGILRHLKNVKPDE